MRDLKVLSERLGRVGSRQLDRWFELAGGLFGGGAIGGAFTYVTVEKADQRMVLIGVAGAAALAVACLLAAGAVRSVRAESVAHIKTDLDGLLETYMETYHPASRDPSARRSLESSDSSLSLTMDSG